MTSYALSFDEIDRSSVAVVGGKGAYLGELSRVEGIRVPAGFCVTTDAFRCITAEAPSFVERLDALSRLKWGDQEAIRALSGGSAEPSKSSRFPTNWRQRSQARTRGWASTPPMPSDPARPRRT